MSPTLLKWFISHWTHRPGGRIWFCRNSETYRKGWVELGDISCIGGKWGEGYPGGACERHYRGPSVTKFVPWSNLIPTLAGAGNVHPQPPRPKEARRTEWPVAYLEHPENGVRNVGIPIYPRQSCGLMLKICTSVNVPHNGARTGRICPARAGSGKTRGTSYTKRENDG